MLDKLPAWLRHLILVFLPTALTYLGATVLPALKDRGTQGDLIAGAGAIGVTYLILLLTPLTQQYGVGKTEETPRVT